MKSSMTSIAIVIMVFLGGNLNAQEDFYDNHPFTEADSLRGMLRPERTCYDVTFYHLDISLDPDQKSIKGQVDIHFRAVEAFDRLQIDLYENMEISQIVFQDQHLEYTRKHNAVFVNFPKQKIGATDFFRVYYYGTPTAAKMAPWDGGFAWSTDPKGNPWVGVACEGAGASLWWPNKDHLSDEPDSMAISIAVPDPLVCVSNGNLRSIEAVGNGYSRYNWWVSYPINNYNVTLNIGNYVHFSDTLTASDGDKLPLDYYVLPENLAKAKKHFAQVPEVLRSFEYYFDKYPFWEDGYALVETPYLGMEHQGAIAYGNKYLRGYLGGMIPNDMDWDYIIVHETGHEYWGNSIGCRDHAEMWINESFTTYMEALYVEYTAGYEDAVRYLNNFRGRLYILNQQPMVGPLDVNWDSWSGSDHYFKGSWMLHTLRHTLQDDELWFDILKSFYREHAISTISTQDFVDYVKARSGRDYIDAFFEQYLKYPAIPRFSYEWVSTKQTKKSGIRCRWENTIPGFNMPVLVGTKGNYQLIQPTTAWQIYPLDDANLEGELGVATELLLIDKVEVE